MNKRIKQLLLACTLPVLILLGMAVIPLYTLLFGEEIILQTKPVDPSDLFRGDYVTLRYEAEEVPREMVEKEVLTELENGNGNITVYVLLEKKNGIHSPYNVVLQKPDEGKYLKGNLQYIGPNIEQKEVAYISYSLDKYFVEDNTGLEWENASTKGEILAKVKVNHGYAYLIDIVKKD